MKTYLVLVRGINVGGRNILPMAGLRQCLEELGFNQVSTYIASGNVILRSSQTPGMVQAQIEEALPRKFKLDDQLIKVLVLSLSQLQAIVDHKPKGFGEEPGQYYDDAIFLMQIATGQAITVFKPREGVDQLWPGEGVIYSRRLGALRTKSRLSSVMGTPAYRSMTIRTWNTTMKLLELMRATDSV
jgi:uncharacterized protein (DUF1697 family)